MAIHKSRFSGDQIDDVIGLFDQKELNNVVGIIERNENGTFSIADLSWAADKVNAISYDSVNKKIIQSIDGVNSDVVSVATLMDDFGVGEANGIVPLNSSSKIDSIFLPSYVDDVLEFNGLSNFPETGETGKIYVDTVTNKTYRWSGSIYVEISPSPIIPTNISAFVNDSGYITGYTETDPVFSASPAAGISATDISNWNSKEIFYAEYNVTTYAQILAAYNADKTIICQADAYDLNSVFPTGNMLELLLVDYNTNTNEFIFGLFVEGFYINTIISSNGWTGVAIPFQSNWTQNNSDAPGYIQNKPTIPTISLNGSSTTAASFYAPTSAGTSGYVLVSSGSGAPTWASIPAGATVTLNGVVSATPSFYAPTTAGTSGQVLTSNGSGAPTWAAAPSGDIFVAEYDVTTFDEIKAAYNAEKYIVLKMIDHSVPTYLNFVGLVDMRTSATPYATAVFSTSNNGNIYGELITCTCDVFEDSENSGQLVEEWRNDILSVQPELVSGTNIKTINNQSILGSGNISISGGSSTQIVTWTEV